MAAELASVEIMHILIEAFVGCDYCLNYVSHHFVCVRVLEACKRADLSLMKYAYNQRRDHSVDCAAYVVAWLPCVCVCAGARLRACVCVCAHHFLPVLLEWDAIYDSKRRDH